MTAEVRGVHTVYVPLYEVSTARGSVTERETCVEAPVSMATDRVHLGVLWDVSGYYGRLRDVMGYYGM